MSDRDGITENPADTGDMMTIAQMTQLLRDDLARLEAAERPYTEAERTWEYTEQRRDLGGPNGEGRDAVRAGLLQAQAPALEAAAKAAAGAAHAASQRAYEHNRVVLRWTDREPLLSEPH